MGEVVLAVALTVAGLGCAAFSVWAFDAIDDLRYRRELSRERARYLEAVIVTLCVAGAHLWGDASREDVLARLETLARDLRNGHGIVTSADDLMAEAEFGREWCAGMFPDAFPVEGE